MASFEMEPMFCKALKLLHSSSKDSADEIMHLLEEVLEQKYGGTKSLNLKSGTLLEEPSKTAEIQKPAKPSRGPSPVQSTPTGQNSEKSSRDSSPPSEPVSSRTSPEVDDCDLALEIFEDDLNCKICKGMSVGPRNRLVECSDCHMLYHQECHKPPILENVNDPRLVWYCSSCTKKTQEKVQPKIKAAPAEPAHKKPKSESSSEIKNPVFKRNDKSSNNSGSNKNSGNGMAHLAASLQGTEISNIQKIFNEEVDSGISDSKEEIEKNYLSSATENSLASDSGQDKEKSATVDFILANVLNDDWCSKGNSKIWCSQLVQCSKKACNVLKEKEGCIGFASKTSTSSLSSKHHSSSGPSGKPSSSLNYSKTPSSPNPKSQSGSAPAPANIIAADKRLQNMKKKAAAKMQEKRSKHK